jgi:hypothetical protein
MALRASVFSTRRNQCLELERSAIRDAQMPERLCFVLAFATLYLTAQGLAVVAADQQATGRCPLAARQ